MWTCGVSHTSLYFSHRFNPQFIQSFEFLNCEGTFWIKDEIIIREQNYLRGVQITLVAQRCDGDVTLKRFVFTFVSLITLSEGNHNGKFGREQHLCEMRARWWLCCWRSAVQSKALWQAALCCARFSLKRRFLQLSCLKLIASTDWPVYLFIYLCIALYLKIGIFLFLSLSWFAERVFTPNQTHIGTQWTKTGRVNVQMPWDVMKNWL